MQQPQLFKKKFQRIGFFNWRTSYLAFLLFFVFLGLYALTSAHSVQGGDSGEFDSLCASGGVAHPPGYPLYSFFLQLSCQLIPLSNVPFKASLLSAMAVALSLALLFWILATQLKTRLVSFFVCTGAGLQVLLWRYATLAEVFGQAVLTAILLVLTALLSRQCRRPWLCAIGTGLAFATGIANHLTVILLWPLPTFALLQLRKKAPTWSHWLRWLGLSAASAISVGLLPYWLLLHPSGAGMRWGNLRQFSDLLGHFLRRSYGTFNLSSGEVALPWWQHPLHYLAGVPERLFGVFFVLAVLGLVVSLKDKVWRPFAIALLLSWIISGPLFVGRFNIPLHTDALLIVERFYIVPDLLLTIFSAWGLVWLWNRGGKMPQLLTLSMSFVLLVQFSLNLQRARHDDASLIEDYGLYTLRSVAPHALIIGGNDNMAGSMQYLQQVLRVRTDVLFVGKGVFHKLWYQEYLRQQHPEDACLLEQSQGSIERLIQLAISQRPVYVRFAEDKLIKQYASAPEIATLLRLFPSHHKIANTRQLEKNLIDNLETFPFRTPPLGTPRWKERADAWVLEQFASGFLELSQRYQAEQDAQSYMRTQRSAQKLAPWLFVH